jgi:hypothetical protein
MTAQSVAVGPTIQNPGRGGMFLGFRNRFARSSPNGCVARVP